MVGWYFNAIKIALNVLRIAKSLKQCIVKS
jgi:hypothetical protein